MLCCPWNGALGNHVKSFIIPVTWLVCHWMIIFLNTNYSSKLRTKVKPEQSILYLTIYVSWHYVIPVLNIWLNLNCVYIVLRSFIAESLSGDADWLMNYPGEDLACHDWSCRWGRVRHIDIENNYILINKTTVRLFSSQVWLLVVCIQFCRHDMEVVCPCLLPECLLASHPSL